MHRKCPEKKYDGAKLGMSEAIQDTASVGRHDRTCKAANGAYSVCHASFPDVRLETENMRQRLRIAGTMAEESGCVLKSGGGATT